MNPDRSWVIFSSSSMLSPSSVCVARGLALWWESMGAPRSRTPNEFGAREIARVLYTDVDAVVWIPSDDADVFRLSFISNREPRILKMATHGIRAVWREIGAFPAMRRLGIPELLQFEHTSEELPDLGIDFHITRELAHPQQASRAMAEMWVSDRARALEVAHWLGDCTGRIESLHWRQVPRANSPERSAEIGADWGTPQYGQLVARSDLPGLGTHVHRSRVRDIEPPGGVRQFRRLGRRAATDPGRTIRSDRLAKPRRGAARVAGSVSARGSAAVRGDGPGAPGRAIPCRLGSGGA